MLVVRSIAFAGLCLLIVGCGSKSDLAKVTGTVTLNGEAYEGAVVQFEPPDGKGLVSAAMTDAEGRYKLMHTFKTPGCVCGEHRVTIRTASSYYEEEDKPWQKERLPARYNARTRLRRTVEPGRNTFNFELTRP